MPQTNVDQIAQSLASVAATIAGSPPSWHSHKDTVLVAGPDGQRLGRGLPGYGIVLDRPLKDLGVTKPIPHVYDRPLVERAINMAGGRERLAMLVLALLSAKAIPFSIPMMAGAIISYDNIINARANGKGEDLIKWKTGAAQNVGQNLWSTTMLYTGTPTAFAFTAALGASAPNANTAGSLLGGFTAPSGGDKMYLLGLGLIANSIAMQAVLLSDMLYESGGISATVTTLQSLAAVALTRYTSGVGVQCSMTPTVALSATASNLTVTYTNTTPTGSRTGVIAHPVTANYGAVGKILPHGLVPPYLQLQAGDVGITSVQSVQGSVALAAGTLGLYLHKPLIYMPGVPTDLYVERELTSSLDGLVELVTTGGGVLGCPILSFISNTASTSTAVGLQAWMKTARG